ncbi:FxsA family protein [Tessaracoccus oleiagri]|uniref:UPF0716 protein FxsA n=1 Tax=Tessaracoccus oleiagri TaxID=686624 RepID=A0A1G9MGE8_9ACTN|nr:FxsA family protein [Tessaracoccus oleiagri]SDL73348.1 UPF0716 protein FxsA [Tessaracoccus oleiagri]
MAERGRGLSPSTILALVVAPFVLLVVLEVAAIIWVAGEIGWWTLLIMAATSALGLVLFAREGRKSIESVQRAVLTGHGGGRELADTGLVVAGASLLLLPGFISDLVGLLFLLPFTRPLVRGAFGWWLGKMARPVGGGAQTVSIRGDVVADEPGGAGRDPMVIEGTVVDHDEGTESDHGRQP